MRVNSRWQVDKATLGILRVQVQDQIIVSHKFCRHMDVNCQGSLQNVNVSDDSNWTTNTRGTIYTHLCTTRPPIVLPVHNGFYPST